MIEGEIERLSGILEAKTDEYATLARGAATAEVDYKLAYARRYLTVKGTVGEREALTLCEVAEPYRDKLIAHAVRDACSESMRSLRSQLSALQTLAANVRAQT